MGVGRDYEENCYFRNDIEGLMLIFWVGLIYCFTYYAFVFVVMIPLSSEYPGFARFSVLVFHATLIMTLVSWISAMMTHPGTPTVEYHPVSTNSFMF
jgi:hypothetical protein